MAYVLISVDAGKETTYSKLKCDGRNLKMLNMEIKTLQKKKLLKLWNWLNAKI